jgi:ATP-dependent helicase/nuclease subunit B
MDLACAGGDAPAARWAETLYTTLVKLKVPRRIAEWAETARRRRDFESAELHRQAWHHLVETLDELHELLGQTRLTLAELHGLLVPALAEATVGIAPPTLDQVLISAIERSRHPEIRHAWIFAFNEGVFPQPPVRSSLLSESARAGLNRAGLPAPLPLREAVFAEPLLAYIAMTRPSQSLTISYALCAENGEAMHPSPLLRELRRVLPQVTVERIENGAPPVCPGEAARGYLRHVPGGPPQLRARYEQLRQSLEGTDAGCRLAWLLRGREYRNEPPPVGNFRAADLPAGVVWDASLSELESYLRCPFQHFARFGLRLDTQRGPAPLSIELGLASHAILAAVTRRALQAGQPPATLSDEQWLKLLEECAAEPLAAIGRGNASPQHEFLARRLCELLREVVLVHAHRWRRGRFLPLAVEQPFGERASPESWPAFELALDSERRVRLHGRIDRVDVWRSPRGSYLLIYDYKTSPSRAALRRPYLIGDQLQLLAYLLAALRAPGLESCSLPGGVLIAPHQPDSGALDRSYVAESPPDEQRMYMYRPRGLFDAAVADALDAQRGEQPHSPVAAMQRRRDGGYHAKSDVDQTGELRARLATVEQTIRCAAEGVAAGRVDVAPLLEGRRLACHQCDFQRLCRFEIIQNRPRRADRALPQVPVAVSP